METMVLTTPVKYMILKEKQWDFPDYLVPGCVTVSVILFALTIIYIFTKEKRRIRCMSYVAALKMPSSYAVMNEEEMTYLEGGVSIGITFRFSFTANIMMTLPGIY